MTKLVFKRPVSRCVPTFWRGFRASSTPLNKKTFQQCHSKGHERRISTAANQTWKKKRSTRQSLGAMLLVGSIMIDRTGVKYKTLIRTANNPGENPFIYRPFIGVIDVTPFITSGPGPQFCTGIGYFTLMLMLKKIPTPSPYSQTLQKEVEVINFLTT